MKNPLISLHLMQSLSPVSTEIGTPVYPLLNGLIAQLDAADQALLLRRAKMVALHVGMFCLHRMPPHHRFIFRSAAPLLCMSGV